MVFKLMSYYYCITTPQIYYLTVLEVRTPKYVSLGQKQDVSRVVFLSEAQGSPDFSRL